MITYDVRIDWDCTDWAGVHDFSDPVGARTYDDISEYVKSPIRIARNKQPDDWVYPAATLELKLNNISGIFYPTLVTGALYGKIRIWLPIRIIATYNAVDYPLYYGFLNKLACYPIRDKGHVYLYATDGIDVLAKSIIIQDMDDKTTIGVVSDGAAVHLLLDAGGWGARHTIDVTGGNIISMPDTFVYEKGE
ncbi:MAG: hypothetical protein MUO99_06070 [Dehalococcoidales bacterium]|nr:hypothetical protein [Dehalococcoidales bacterium]